MPGSDQNWEQSVRERAFFSRGKSEGRPEGQAQRGEHVQRPRISAARAAGVARTDGGRGKDHGRPP